ncbi:hypothetical protein HYH02_003298 [Chlamydomonas schloesseri]|uniref:Methyltransferase type 11 domain-containing protein n=1 Tax=Chlamydomonas schloesseri TaxID=2026947 RepID=A0A836BAQ3_9CHLO|nr:hypothetical protein HYH02_003298 [Chlamydomonas schloesseri]|eukprot:KAG2452274.1 hypothetical protein HYH02_003298 [Chlamydomonas schloesseri]
MSATGTAMRSATRLASCAAARGPALGTLGSSGASSSAASGAEIMIRAFASSALAAPCSNQTGHFINMQESIAANSSSCPCCSSSSSSSSSSATSGSSPNSAGANATCGPAPPPPAAWPPLARRRMPPAAGLALLGTCAAAGSAPASSSSSSSSSSTRLQLLQGLRRCLHSGASAATAASAAAAAAGGGGGGCRSPGPGVGVGDGDGPGTSGRRPGGAAGWGTGSSGGGARSPPREEGLGAVLEVFNKPLKSLQRDRSSALLDGGDPLLGAISGRLLDRLEDCRVRFPTAVVLGGAAVPVVRQLGGGRAGIERVIVVDPSQDMLDRLQREEAEARANPDPDPGAKPWPAMSYVRGDEEHLPLAPKSVDLIISCLGLHWANDLPGAMAQCRAALVPDGLFLAALLGGDTLQELRIACALAQMEREGGVSAVVSPLAQVRDAGNLLTRADLRLPSVDVDAFHIGYPSSLELVQHLRALGEGNASVQRRRMLPRDSALAAAAVYQSMFGFRPHQDDHQEEQQQEEEAQGRQEQEQQQEQGDGNGDGNGVTATFQVIFMTGWAPSPHQPKAAKRGSATVSFQDLADGLVKGGQAVGGTADEGIVAGAAPGQEQEPSPLPSRRA